MSIEPQSQSSAFFRRILIRFTRTRRPLGTLIVPFKIMSGRIKKFRIKLKFLITCEIRRAFIVVTAVVVVALLLTVLVLLVVIFFSVIT